MPFFTSENGPVVLDMMYSLYIIARSDGVTNRGAYKSDAMDKLIDDAGRTLDRDKRNDLTRQAQELWNKDAPWVMTVFQPFYEVMPKTICGYVYYPDETERWHDLKPCR
jgi:ABC-type transport system substrate-binding protein